MILMAFLVFISTFPYQSSYSFIFIYSTSHLIESLLTLIDTFLYGPECRYPRLLDPNMDSDDTATSSSSTRTARLAGPSGRKTFARKTVSAKKAPKSRGLKRKKGPRLTMQKLRSDKKWTQLSDGGLGYVNGHGKTIRKARSKPSSQWLL